MNEKKYIQIYWTCGSLEEAREVATHLVQQHLVACANIIPHVESIFLWKGKIETEQEYKVIFKTQEEKFQAVKEMILAKSSYDLPEIIKIPITGGHKAYLDWIDETVEKKNPL